MVFMKKSLLFIFLLILTMDLQAQKDSVNVSGNSTQKGFIREAANVNISIYPVPVSENSFTIKCDRDISAVKVTNMIGQDIYRTQYNNPQSLTKIFLENPKRGMYLVTINFSDGSRVVKKIMIEVSE